MARLTEEEKKELLEDARSSERGKDFSKLSERTKKGLSPSEFIEFLDWSQPFMKEDSNARPPIQGHIWLI